MAHQVSIGLDLGSSAIKLVQLEREKKGAAIRLVTAAVVPTPSLFVSGGGPSEQEVMAVLLRKLFHDVHITMKEVTVALSESLVFTRVIELPLLSDAELASAIRWQAEQYIPLPLTDVTMDHIIVNKPSDGRGNMRVLLVAAPLRVIERTLKMLELAQLVPIALETEIIATTRAYSDRQARESVTMVVDSGAITTDISILVRGTLMFTHTTSLAGEAITRTVASGFNFERAQAEEYKKVYGLDERHFQGKVHATIKPIVDSIVEEIRKSVAYYQEKNPANSVKSIILSGGTALLPGLVGYIANVLGIEVQLGNPWSDVVIDPLSVITAPPQDAPIFGVATGLALRSLLTGEST